MDANGVLNAIYDADTQRLRVTSASASAADLDDDAEVNGALSACYDSTTQAIRTVSI